ncbi:unnamed protein product [Cuscuta epithymum]|uniref:Remorin C-terminal domain-containing protein n=1 Tax=Cuscuta epithymum TaxID=186058 RepID=A0AAV0F925_9ASTE|nr:unnamed protein product [Cuscuta epithymum]
MAELGFQQQMQARAREISPDSVILAADSNFSLFSSSTPGSIDRSSLAADTRDIESSFYRGPQTDLARHVYSEASGGTSSDPNKHSMHETVYLRRNAKAKANKADNGIAETGNTELSLDLASTSFSQALKECQDRRSRSEGILKKSDRKGTDSLDTKNCFISPARFSSPQYGHMKKPVITDRRHSNTKALPKSNGRTLPSKWADAERWITSPISRDSAVKSKSGPLRTPVIALYSPAELTSEEGKCAHLQASSPSSTGVMDVYGLSIQYGGHDIGGTLVSCNNLPITRSISVNGCPELFCLSSLSDFQDESDSNKVVDTNISRIASKDMGHMVTQMIPKGRHSLSPKRCSSPPTTRSSILPITEVQSFHSPKEDIRNVLDEHVTLTRWRKKHRIRIPGASVDIFDYWKSNAAIGLHSDGWDISKTANSLSQVKREEARITAWENLQKAKAEAAIQKFEVKLQKKRSTSMDKILNKLRSAQKKAAEMRTSMLAGQNQEVVRFSHRALTLRRTHHMGSFGGCFTCHAF